MKFYVAGTDHQVPKYFVCKSMKFERYWLKIDINFGKVKWNFTLQLQTIRYLNISYVNCCNSNDID